MLTHFFTRNIIANIDMNTSFKSVLVTSEWCRVTINHELRIRKTYVDYCFRKNQASIFFSIIELSWSDFPDMELTFKFPIINLLTFFILSWTIWTIFILYQNDHYYQSNYFLHLWYFTYLEHLKTALKFLLNSESRWCNWFVQDKKLLKIEAKLFDKTVFPEFTNWSLSLS